MSKQSKSLFLAVLGLFSVLACSFYSLNASAVDLTHAVTYQGSGSNPQWHDDSTSSVSNTWHTGRIVYGGNSGNAAQFSSFSIRGNNGSNIPIQSSWYFQVSGRMSFSGTDNKWNTSGNFIYTSVGNCPIIDMDTTEVQSHAGSTSNTTQIYNYTLTCKYSGSNSGIPQVGFKVQSTSQLDTFQFSVQNWFMWSAASGFDDSAIISAINNVRTSVNNVYNAIGTTNNKLNDTNSKLDDLKEITSTLNDTQEQANQDAQDRYEQDKQEESSREQSQQQQSSNAQNVFNFSVLNPFSGLFSLFQTSCTSYYIPIIGGWLHMAGPRYYTSWWCSIGDSTGYNVRTVLTPVIGLSSMMLLFGFVVRWLSRNSGDIYGARNMNKGLNG